MESQWVQCRNMEAWLVHNFFLCSITQNENLSMILDEWSQNLLTLLIKLYIRIQIGKTRLCGFSDWS